MTLVSPERWYVLFWLTAGIVALSPIYWFLWKLVKMTETIQFILSVTSRK